jgi:hypothetical protein
MKREDMAPMLQQIDRRAVAFVFADRLQVENRLNWGLKKAHEGLNLGDIGLRNEMSLSSLFDPETMDDSFQGCVYVSKTTICLMYSSISIGVLNFQATSTSGTLKLKAMKAWLAIAVRTLSSNNFGIIALQDANPDLRMTFL